MPVDYLVLYPFKIKQDDAAATPPLGVKGCTLICEALQTEMPLLVEENIALSDVTAILDTGISGIAVASAITQNFNTIKRFNKLLGASSTQEQRHTFK